MTEFKNLPSIWSAIQKLRFLFTREEKVKWVGIVILALCTAFFEMLTTGTIIAFTQTLNQPEIGRKYLSFIGLKVDWSPKYIICVAILCVGVMYLLKSMVAFSEIFYQNYFIQNSNYHFKNNLLRQYANMDYELHLTRNSSLNAQIIDGDVDQIFANGVVSLGGILSEGLIFLCLVGMIIFINPSLSFFIFGIAIILGFLITKVFLPRFYQFGKALQQASLSGSQNLFQFFHAFKEVVLQGKKEVFINAYRESSKEKSRIRALQAVLNNTPRLAIELLFVIFFMSIIVLLCMREEAPMQWVGVLGGYLYVGFRITPGLNRIINYMNIFKSTIAPIERIYQDYKDLVAEENYVDIPEFQFEKELSLKNVRFKYRNASRQTLKDISFSMNKGESIGIVGKTGSGKSTLINIILGLLKPCQGSIRVDGKHPVNAGQWHQNIGYVPQNIYLMDDSIEANIVFGDKEVDEELLNSVLDTAQLRQFITQLPDGLKTRVGERGVRISGGELQRIAIARALYRRPSVLIFDEATSALDSETEIRLIESIRAVSKDYTVIMIAHRISTLKNCDRILVMEKGKIIQMTTYEMIQEPPSVTPVS